MKNANVFVDVDLTLVKCDGDDGEELVMELRSDHCATAGNKPTKT